jgi:gamma-glutamylcyclotransferase (GGCT)/AIG2-like uncharacterized protein YtfP
MKEFLIAVNGSLMRGFALNENLLAVNAEFIREDTTAAHYRLWSINDHYPAMQHDLSRGNSIDVEIWKMTPEALLKILESEPPGLCLGRIELMDKQWVFGILGEGYICQGMQEITKWGGWRNYFAHKKD